MILPVIRALVIITTSILCISSSAIATLTTSNIDTLPSPDGQNLTIDSITGYEWLDVTVTSNVSVTNVVARFVTDLSGFRYATQHEVNQFFSHMPLPMFAPSLESKSYPSGEYFLAATAYIGITDIYPGLAHVTNGYVAESPGNPLASRYITELYGGLSNGNIAGTWVAFTSGFFDTVFPTSTGSYLVRVVPEPAAATMMIGAAMVLGGRRLRARCR